MQPPDNLVDYRNYKRKAVFTDKPEEMLKIVAADITTETKAIFPLMAKLYWENPDKVHPADYVRASMSIPIFFYPYKVGPVPEKNKDGKPIRQDWIECAKYRGDTPKECYFVDGGVISNFPINLFHDPKRTPRMPTFGARLSADRNINPVDNPLSLINTVFAAARHSLDFDFLSQNPDYEKVVTRIDTGNHNWLNFALSNEDMYDLFRLGAEAAYEFLRNFRWDDYRNIRESMKEAQKQAEAYTVKVAKN
jgi:NTE family protein